MSEKYRAGISDRHYYWRAESQLDSVIDSENSGVKYEYNALGKPVIKSRKSLGGSWSVDSYYVWDGDQLLLELDGSGNRRADYMYYPGTIDTPAAEELGATDITQFRDHQIDGEGNVTGIVYAGTVSQQVSYDAWGTPTISGNTDNRLLWKGLMWEGDLVSLYYVRNRWYDPELGRFASEDPIGHAGGENLYTFAGNDPINASDPSGMSRQAELLSGITVWADPEYWRDVPIPPVWFGWGGGGDAATPRGLALSSDLGANGGGGGREPVTKTQSKHSPSRDWGECREKAIAAALSVSVDIITAGELRTAWSSGRLSLGLARRALGRLSRNGGYVGNNVLRELSGAGAQWAIARNAGLAASLNAGQGMYDAANFGSSIVDALPFVGSIHSLYKVGSTCISTLRGH